MSKARAQGTAWESRLRRIIVDAGFNCWRLPEGGSRDAGDLVFVTDDGSAVVVEAKRRERLPVHETLTAAKVKSAKGEVPGVVKLTVVVWDRPVRVEGRVRRVAAGEPVVIVGLTDFLGLLKEG